MVGEHGAGQSIQAVLVALKQFLHVGGRIGPGCPSVLISLTHLAVTIGNKPGKFIAPAEIVLDNFGDDLLHLIGKIEVP